MKWKTVLRVSVLVAIASVWLGMPTAFACVPDDETGRCIIIKPNLYKARPTVVTAKATAIPTPTRVVAQGTGPQNAITPDEVWRTIEANASVWYRIGEGVNSQRLDVWLDSRSKDAVSFAVYSPDQMNAWTPAIPAKGRGSPNRADPSHDLSWSGHAPAGGTWYVVVSNNTSVAASYRVGYNKVSTAGRKCTSYWETVCLPWDGKCYPTYWTACE